MLRELSCSDPFMALWNRRHFRKVLSGGLHRVQEKAGKGQASIDVDASRASTVRSATPPGIWFCGSSQSSRGRSSPIQRRSHGLGETGFVLLLPDADEGALFRRLEAIREACACTERLLVHTDRDVRFSISVGGYRFTLSAL